MNCDYNKFFRELAKMCNFSLEHNEHKLYYEHVTRTLLAKEHMRFRNEESKEKTVHTNEIWVLQFYPTTPVGFDCIAAPTLEELIEFFEEL